MDSSPVLGPLQLKLHWALCVDQKETSLVTANIQQLSEGKSVESKVYSK